MCALLIITTTIFVVVCVFWLVFLCCVFVYACLSRFCVSNRQDCIIHIEQIYSSRHSTGSCTLLSLLANNISPEQWRLVFDNVELSHSTFYESDFSAMYEPNNVHASAATIFSPATGVLSVNCQPYSVTWCRASLEFCYRFLALALLLLSVNKQCDSFLCFM